MVVWGVCLWRASGIPKQSKLSLPLTWPLYRLLRGKQLSLLSVTQLPCPHTHSVRAERDHVGPRGCPGLLHFLPPLQALPVLSSSKEGLPLVPCFPLGFGEAPAFSWEVNPLPSGLRPLSASRPLVKVPSAPDSTRGGVFTVLCADDRASSNMFGKRCVCPALEIHRDLSGNLGVHVGNMGLGSPSDAHQGDVRRGTLWDDDAQEERRPWSREDKAGRGWLRAGRWLQAEPKGLEAGAGTASLGAF